MAGFGDTKVIESKKMDMTEGGRGGNGSNGPTGSSRSYPKGGKGPADTQDAPFNPQRVRATGVYVDGV